MRNPKFTKGPWTITEPNEGRSKARINGSYWSGLAKVYVRTSIGGGPRLDNAKGKANARAISAVPEMYTLLAELEGVDTLAPVFTDRIKSLLDKIDNI